MKKPVLDVQKIRKDFPVLAQKMNAHPLVYLDNAATTQKPKAVIDRIYKFYHNEYATVHRGVYALSQSATWENDHVREKCRDFLNAGKSSEIIFVRGATEAINLVAHGYASKFVEKGDEIIVSQIEHHANLVPWQRVCEEKGAVLRVIPVDDSGELFLGEYQKLLNAKTKIVAVGHVSNALGTIHPVKEITKLAHQAGAKVLIDGAQAAPHQRVDVRDIDCDFYCFSGHKVYGPTGVGVLYAKEALLEKMDPYQTGGEMIESVSFEKTTFAKAPAKFEAGTPSIAEIVGLGAALDYVQGIGLEAISAYEGQLLEKATQAMSQIEGLKIIGTASRKAAVISFLLGDIHPHDIGTIVDQEGIAIRTGHHCSQTTMQRYGLNATARVSFAFYNTFEEIDKMAGALQKVKDVFQ